MRESRACWRRQPLAQAPADALTWHIREEVTLQSKSRDWAEDGVGFAAEDELLPPGPKRLVAASILGLVALGAAAFGFYEIRQGLYYSGWKPVSARVVQVDSKEISAGGKPRGCVIATYRYRVRGKTHTSSQHTPSHRCETFTHSARAGARVKNLRAHPKVTAYYDPDHPARAALEPGASTDYVVGSLSLAGALIPLLIALLLVRAHRRHHRAHEAWKMREQDAS